MWPPPAARTTLSRYENSSQKHLSLSQSAVLIVKIDLSCHQYMLEVVVDKLLSVTNLTKKITHSEVRDFGRPSAESEVFSTSHTNALSSSESKRGTAMDWWERY